METLQHHTGSFTQGIIICMIGVLFCYFVGRRRFNRRGIGGLQHYNCYGTAVITTLFEKLVKFVGIILLIVGLCLAIKGYQGQPDNTTSKQINHPKK